MTKATIRELKPRRQTVKTRRRDRLAPTRAQQNIEQLMRAAARNTRNVRKLLARGVPVDATDW